MFILWPRLDEMKTGTPERGWGWGQLPSQLYADKLTLFQPGVGADYAHHITTYPSPPPRFMDGTPPLLEILTYAISM